MPAAAAESSLRRSDRDHRPAVAVPPWPLSGLVKPEVGKLAKPHAPFTAIALVTQEPGTTPRCIDLEVETVAVATGGLQALQNSLCC